MRATAKSAPTTSPTDNVTLTCTRAQTLIWGKIRAIVKTLLPPTRRLWSFETQLRTSILILSLSTTSYVIQLLSLIDDRIKKQLETNAFVREPRTLGELTMFTSTTWLVPTAHKLVRGMFGGPEVVKLQSEY